MLMASRRSKCRSFQASTSKYFLVSYEADAENPKEEAHNGGCHPRTAVVEKASKDAISKVQQQYMHADYESILNIDLTSAQI